MRCFGLQGSEWLTKGQITDNVECHSLISLSHVECCTLFDSLFFEDIDKTIYCAPDQLFLLSQRRHREGIGQEPAHVGMPLRITFGVDTGNSTRRKDTTFVEDALYESLVSLTESIDVLPRLC
ncbi:hypothetical protein RRF57_012989 [Xylaria bambusicola]|uniref:Uncharacterized protein n=1 Tax=Xylaria bambusicola TaxID=326684 RepID=A0AAN7V0A8_9PEZI